MGVNDVRRADMAQIETHLPSRTLRGRWDEILAHSSEISRDAEVEVRVFEPKKRTPTMELMRAWLEEDATNDPEEIRAAEGELREFKRNMNLPRKEAGARLLYPEAE
jgi:hypothetical protein